MLTQLTRIELGKNLQSAHLKDRQLICKWCYEKGLNDNVITKVSKNGKTYFVINDYQKLRNLFGELLKELQRITSEGDYLAAKNLVETYAVKVDFDLHKEVLDRWKKLNVAPYGGFLNPDYKPLLKDGKIVDIKVSYETNFEQQMINYSKNYSFLPTFN